MDERLDRLARAVGATLGGTGWAVAPLPGSSDRSFVVTGPRRLVLRFVEAPGVLEYLGRAAVAPGVVARSATEGRDFVLQEYVESPRIDGGWIAAHHGAVAHLFAVVAADARLARLAEPLATRRFVHDLAELTAREAPAGAREIVLELDAMAATLEEVPLVPSHGDPNASNFLDSREGLRLIDWDDLRLADPLRDLGQVAWWYLPEADWPRFMAAAGARWDEHAQRRLAWWVAAESLDVAARLFHVDVEMAAGFVRDAEAAIVGRPNPRRA